MKVITFEFETILTDKVNKLRSCATTTKCELYKKQKSTADLVELLKQVYQAQPISDQFNPNEIRYFD